MRDFFNIFLIGLTTVFAWVPATILLIMLFIGIYTGFVNFTEMDLVRLLGLCCIGIMSIAGYVGLTSICWGLKLPIKTKVLCLVSGLFALSGSIVIGYMSENTSLHVSFSIEEAYLILSPLFFVVLHTALEIKKLILTKTS